MSTTRLLLIRHAEVEARYQRIFGGRIDMEISPNGRRQAAALARQLQRQPPVAIYASPMKRVHQTLAPLVASGAPAPVIMPDLREVDFGDWTGLGWGAVQSRFGVSAFDWLNQLERGAIPNAESGAELRARIEPCLLRIIANHTGREAAVFCHGGVIRVMLSILLELPLSKTRLFKVDYASITRVALHPHQVEMELLNFTPSSDNSP